MMGPAFYVMAILGCGEADAACEPVGVTEQMYQSIEACTEATPDAVSRHSELAYPVVVAQCQPGDRSISYKILPHEVDLPEPERDPDLRRATFRKRPGAYLGQREPPLVPRRKPGPSFGALLDPGLRRGALG